MANEERNERREAYIDSLQNGLEMKYGVRPKREQIDQFIGEHPGEIKSGAPPWIKPGPSDTEVKNN